MDARFIDLLKTLVRQPSVVGAEHSFFRVLQRELEERGASVSWYEGVLVAQGSDPTSVMMSAHIDRHGLMCTGPNEFQYAAFVAGGRSDLLGNSASEQFMQKIAGRLSGLPVYAYEPWSGSYRGSGQVERAFICDKRKNLIFDVEGLTNLVPGTPVAFRDRLSLDSGMLSGQLDNVLTAAMLVDLFSHGFAGTAFFTAQEEAGKSWRYLLEWFRRFGEAQNRLIVLDTSPYPDAETASAQDVVLRAKDVNATFNADMTRQLETCCCTLDVRLGYKDAFIEAEQKKRSDCNGRMLSLGSTEMGRIIMASDGTVDGTTLQIPTTGYHTMQETASVAACQAFRKVLLRISAHGLASEGK